MKYKSSDARKLYCFNSSIHLFTKIIPISYHILYPFSYNVVKIIYFVIFLPLLWKKALNLLAFSLEEIWHPLMENLCTYLHVDRNLFHRLISFYVRKQSPRICEEKAQGCSIILLYIYNSPLLWKLFLSFNMPHNYVIILCFYLLSTL